jgi:GMP synthase (glutamine-hydrolysing)
MESKELILILDFGGQYNQLIARRVRECNVYSEVVPYDISLEKVKEKNPKGTVLLWNRPQDSPIPADGKKPK